MMGWKENADILYLIDFGYAHDYIDIETGKHIPNRPEKVQGNTAFSSTKLHQGFCNHE